MLCKTLAAQTTFPDCRVIVVPVVYTAQSLFRFDKFLIQAGEIIRQVEGLIWIIDPLVVLDMMLL